MSGLQDPFRLGILLPGHGPRDSAIQHLQHLLIVRYLSRSNFTAVFDVEGHNAAVRGEFELRNW